MSRRGRATSVLRERRIEWLDGRSCGITGAQGAPARLTDGWRPRPDGADKAEPPNEDGRSRRTLRFHHRTGEQRGSCSCGTSLTGQRPDDLTVAVIMVGRAVRLGVLDVDRLRDSTRLEQGVRNGKPRGRTELCEEEREGRCTTREESPPLQSSTRPHIERSDRPVRD